MKIEIKNLVKCYGSNRAVDDISFELKSGNIYGFVGPNGAGKTTTLRVMTTLEQPSSGDILYDGVSSVYYPDKIRHLIGFMPDSLPENKDIKVWEYLDFFARAYNLQGEEKEQRLKYIEDFVNLKDLQFRYIKYLSKGMKQRVSLARALIHDPEILIMDEPAAGLDPRARLELRELLKTIAKQGKIVFLSSHILTELQDMCDEAIIIEQGKLLFAGKINEIKESSDNSNQSQELNKVSLSIDFISEASNALKVLEEVENISNIILNENNISLDLKITSKSDIFEIAKILVLSDCKFTSFNVQKNELEDIFMKITKGAVQ